MTATSAEHLGQIQVRGRGARLGGTRATTQSIALMLEVVDDYLRTGKPSTQSPEDFDRSLITTRPTGKQKAQWKTSIYGKPRK